MKIRALTISILIVVMVAAVAVVTLWPQVRSISSGNNAKLTTTNFSSRQPVKIIAPEKTEKDSTLASASEASSPYSDDTIKIQNSTLKQVVTTPDHVAQSAQGEGYSTPTIHPGSEAIKVKGNSSANWGLYLGAGIVFVLLVLIGMAFRYRSWRIKTLMMSPHIVTPESFSKVFGSVEKAIHQLAQEVSSTNHSVHLQREELQKSSEELARTFLTLQGALDQRDKQLKKAEDGCEQLVYKKFVLRFAKVDEMLHEDVVQDTTKLLDDVRTMLRDALEECGVEPFYPTIGSDYRKEIGAAENPVRVETSDESKAFQISEVIKPGYCIVRPDGGKSIVIPSKVEIFIFKEAVHG